MIIRPKLKKSSKLIFKGHQIKLLSISINGKQLKSKDYSISDKELIIDALNFSNRTLGFVNAPALGQRLVENSINALADINKYKTKRDYFYSELINFGYEIVRPTGGFYLFPKSPINDIEFTNLLKKEKILVVPGTGFGAPGYFRISYSVDDSVIENSLDGFKKVIKSFKT